MATDTVDRRAAHVRGLTVTTLASLAGVVAALASQAIAGSATDNVALYILLGSIVVQFPILKVLGIDVDDFSAKDYLYIGFMTFSLWFVAWGVLLTANTAISF
ncbi:EMC6-like membrane protein [Halorientalis salina]|uniref:EMC6-like membrane protein n=1 Tax=Halorientalis salina TaxID=2932266 RepID=UPI0010AC6BC5|nr:hypothetical protein [Halorientalis salina]